VVGLRSRDLSLQQNEYVRALVRELLRETTQSALAPRLGLKQNSLSAFVTGTGGTSFAVARRAAEMAGLDVEDVLAGRIGPRDPYPARSRVLVLAADDAHPQAIERLRAFEPGPGATMTAVDWMRLLVLFDDLARKGALADLRPEPGE